MKKPPINLTVAALTFIVGILAALGYQYLHEVSVPKDSLSQSPQIPLSFRPEMIEVMKGANEPLKVLGIRVAEDNDAGRELLIDVENTSPKRIAYFYYSLGYFNDCANAYYLYDTIGISPPNGTNGLPLDMALKPKQRFTVRLSLSGGSYRMMMAGRRERNCPSITKTELSLSLVVFSDITKRQRIGELP